MKAMILAAGFGTRLRPLTDAIPKALVKINGTPMLEILIRKMITSGIRDIIVNTHHHAEMIIDFLIDHNNFGINIQISHEVEEILGTGGGLKQAAHFFDDQSPFLLHNVDIISNLDFSQMFDAFNHNDYIALLAVMNRVTKRYFLAGDDNLIYGHVNKKTQTTRLFRMDDNQVRETAFCGIHLISPRLLEHLTTDGYYSIVDVYLQLINEGYKIGAYSIDHCYWKDLGKIEHIRDLEADIAAGKIVLK